MQQDHATTQDVVNNLINKASSGLDQITQMLSKHAPEAWALACKGVYAIGASEIAVGILGLVFGAALMSASVWFFRRAAAICVEDGQPYRNDAEWPFFVGGFALGAPALMLLIFAFSHLLDSDGWARVLAPDGYLAQQIITAATN